MVFVLLLQPSFRRLAAIENNTIVWLLAEGCTDMYQPFDQGYGRAVKDGWTGW
jgi:hypothetical protein